MWWLRMDSSRRCGGCGWIPRDGVVTADGCLETDLDMSPSTQLQRLNCDFADYADYADGSSCCGAPHHGARSYAKSQYQLLMLVSQCNTRAPREALCPRVQQLRNQASPPSDAPHATPKQYPRNPRHPRNRSS